MMLEKLNEPFKYEAYRVNYGGNSYVGVNWVVERLNDVLTPLNWTHEILEVTENLDELCVEALGKLSIYNEERQEWISRYQYGNDTMTQLQDSKIVTAQARMDCKKSAISDSLKKTAGLFGAALDVYKNVITVVNDQNKLYPLLANKYPHIIDIYRTHKNGIPILPDSYKEYYQEKEWVGIFKSDMLALVGSSSSTPATRAANSNAQSANQQSRNNRASNNTATSNTTSNASRQASKSTTEKASNNTNNNTSNNTSNNAPAPFRVKVNSRPVINQDKSSTFIVIMEDRTEAKVIAHKNLYQVVSQLVLGEVIHFTGWYSNQTIRISYKQGISSEKNQAG